MIVKGGDSGITFKVDETLSVNDFYKHVPEGLDKWEPDTFHVLDLFKNDDGILIDIGAWIGPISLYSSSLYKKIIAIEADPVAIEGLRANISCSNAKNITVVTRALSDKDNEKIAFGGNGPLGNSESSMLINDSDYLNKEGRTTVTWKDQNHHKATATTIKLETLFNTLKIDPAKVSLIKMDIEGGEKIVLPAIKDYLMSINVPLLMSLHPAYLQKSDIITLVNMLFDIYDKCYWINSDKEKVSIKKETILEETDIYYDREDRLTMMNGLPGTRYFSLLFEK